MILTHGANSIARGGGNTEHIGDKDYKVVTMPDGKVWMAENLDYKFTGCVIGASGYSSSEARGYYYNNDETTYGWGGEKYGLLYNKPALESLHNNKSTFFPGWHIPTQSEWESLLNVVGDLTSGGTALKSPSKWNGDGTTQFELLHAGIMISGGFYSGTNASYLWTKTGDYAVSFLTNNTGYSWDSRDSSDCCSIRLVKDAT